MWGMNMAVYTEVLAVGQGMCNLLFDATQTPDGDFKDVKFLALIDCGYGQINEKCQDIVIKKIKCFMSLRAAYAKKHNPDCPPDLDYYLDILVISHSDSDHIDMLPDLLKDLHYLCVKHDPIKRLKFKYFCDYNIGLTQRAKLYYTDEEHPKIACAAAEQSIYFNDEKSMDTMLSIEQEGRIVFKKFLIKNSQNSFPWIILNLDVNFIFLGIEGDNIDLSLRQSEQDNSEFNLEFYINQIEKSYKEKFKVPQEIDLSVIGSLLECLTEEVHEILKNEDPKCLQNVIKEMKCCEILWNEAVENYKEVPVNICDINGFDEFELAFFPETGAGKICIDKFAWGGRFTVSGTDLLGEGAPITRLASKVIKILSDVSGKDCIEFENRKGDVIELSDTEIMFYYYNYYIDKKIDDSDFDYKGKKTTHGIFSQIKKFKANSPSVFCSFFINNKVYAVFSGDITYESIEWILENSTDHDHYSKPAVMTAPHHGSIITAVKNLEDKDSEKRWNIFFAGIDPENIIVSAAYNSKHGHPHRLFMQICAQFYLRRKKDIPKHYDFFNSQDSGASLDSGDNRKNISLSRTSVPIYTIATTDKTGLFYSYSHYIISESGELASEFNPFKTDDPLSQQRFDDLLLCDDFGLSDLKSDEAFLPHISFPTFIAEQ
jgi:hypothetical protein